MRRQPNGKRWSNPVTPLQAARYQRRWTGQLVVDRIRKICPGWAGNPCRLDVSKLSDYENGHRRPGLTHVEAFCRLYQLSPEALGLITWRAPVPRHAVQLTSATFDRLLAAPRDDSETDDGPSDDQLIDLLAEATALTTAASVACRELRTALQQRAEIAIV